MATTQLWLAGLVLVEAWLLKGSLSALLSSFIVNPPSYTPLHSAWTSVPTPPDAIHISGYSVGSYTAVALEVEYRLLSRRLQQPMLQRGATAGALGCPVQCLFTVLLPHFCACNQQLVTDPLPPHRRPCLGG